MSTTGPILHVHALLIRGGWECYYFNGAYTRVPFDVYQAVVCIVIEYGNIFVMDILCQTVLKECNEQVFRWIYSRYSFDIYI